jgi:hypothetical protein
MTNRHSPPGRTSMECVDVVNLRGPTSGPRAWDQSKCENKAARRAKMRVRMSSFLACPAAELLVVSAMLFLLGFKPTQIVVQAVEPLLPSHAIVLDPVGDVFKSDGMDPARAPLCSPAAGDKPCVFKHFYVLGDGRHAHLKGLGKLGHRSFAGQQVSKNRSTSGVRERCESGGELVQGVFWCVFGSHEYLTGWLNTTLRFCCQPVWDETLECGPGTIQLGTGECRAGKRRTPAVLSGRLAFFFFTAAEAVIILRDTG